VRNHDQKIKDMSRSVLPATQRAVARDARRAIHKRQRGREQAAVTAYRRAADPGSATPDVRGTYGPDISAMVAYRRGADKVGPLIRWAQARIAADPALRAASRAEQVAYFARLMPPTLIGRHAVMHIEQALEWRDRRARSAAGRPAAPGPDAAQLERQLRRILDAGLHATLNAGLRTLAGHPETRPRGTGIPHRPLLGSHDVEAFTATMGRWSTVRELIAVLAETGQVPAGLASVDRGLQQAGPRRRQRARR
jgi:hypothetical protein